MAYTVSLATLSRRALQRVNLEGVRATQFIKEPELTELVNGSIAKWVDEVRGTTWNGTYNRSTQSISTADGISAYPLEDDFLSLISVDITIAGGSPVISARPFQEEERNVFRNYPVMSGWGFGSPIFYQLQGTDIAFIPVPQGVYSVTVNYVPTAPVLVDQDDTIDSVNGWEEFIVLDVAIKCLLKAGELETIPALEQRFADERGRIRMMAPRRDQQGAERVHVIQNAGYFGDGWDW